MRQTRQTRSSVSRGPLTAVILLWMMGSAQAQYGTKNGEWPFYGGDAGGTKYSPLDQINKDNVQNLSAWRWKAENFGPRPDFNYRATPLMVNRRRSIGRV